MSTPSVKALSQELSRALLRAIVSAYHGENHTRFKGALTAPQFALGDSAVRLGRYDAGPRVLEISERLATTEPWSTVVEVLRHEMAHQYVIEVLRIDDESAHGPAFRAICEKLGIDARASGLPAQTDEEDRLLARVAKLLALAESSSKHEAEAAMNAAQRLMLKHNLEHVGQKTYATRSLGAPTGRVSEAARGVAAILGEHFFVEIIWVPVYRPLEGKRGSVLEISGTRENLEMASYVYAFLHHAAARLWREHKAREGIRGDRDKRTFEAGVIAGFHSKLDEERTKNQKAGLVWVRDADLRGYYRKRHPNVVTVRYGTSSRSEIHREGRAAGRSLVLHKPLTKGPSGGRKLLTS